MFDLTKPSAIMWRLDDNNRLTPFTKAEYWRVLYFVKKFKRIPDLCEKCGKNRIHGLANIDHRYRKNVADWVHVCVPCKIKYFTLDYSKVQPFMPVSEDNDVQM